MRWVVLLLVSGCMIGLVEAAEPEVSPATGLQKFLGLDDTSSPTSLQDGRAQDLQNVLLSNSYDLRKRYGVSLPITTGTDALKLGDILDIQDEAFCAVTGLYYTKFSSGIERIMATCGSRFYYMNGVASWDQVTGATITGGQNNQFVWTTALDNAIGTNDVDTPIQYNGTTLTTVSFTGLSNAIQNAKTVTFFKNYLIFGNTKENSVERPTRIRWSNVGTINTWTDGDFIDIGALGGQEINCVAEQYDSLILGLTDSLYKVSLVGGSDTFQISKITDDVGCIAKNSMQSLTLPNGQSVLVFLNKHKEVYSFNGIVAQNLTPLITVTMAGWRGSRLPNAVSADTGTHYVLCATNGSSDTANNLCLDFQYQIGEWSKHTNIPANAMASVLDADGLRQVYFGSYKSLVYQYQDTDLVNDVGTTSPTTITVDSVSAFTTATASGLVVLYDAALNLVTGELVGAPIELVGGTGVGQTNTVIDNTSTGIIVSDTFSTTPDTTTTAEVGAIDAFYTSRWLDMGTPARLKHFGELYQWAEDSTGDSMTLSYAMDFGSDLASLAVALSADTAAGIWDVSLWDVATWGGSTVVFKQSKLESEGRYLRVKWADDDPNESFHLYGWLPVFWSGDVF